MITLENLKSLEPIFNCKFVIQNRDKAGKWKRVFVIAEGGCQIGRMTFQQGKFYGAKCYKKWHYTDVCETDKLWMRMIRYSNDGFVITEDIWNELIQQAEKIVADDLAEKKKWRDDNPKFKIVNGEKVKAKRKRLQGKSLRGTLSELISDYGRKT